MGGFIEELDANPEDSDVIEVDEEDDQVALEHVKCDREINVLLL